MCNFHIATSITTHYYLFYTTVKCTRARGYKNIALYYIIIMCRRWHKFSITFFKILSRHVGLTYYYYSMKRTYNVMYYYTIFIMRTFWKYTRTTHPIYYAVHWKLLIWNGEHVFCNFFFIFFYYLYYSLYSKPCICEVFLRRVRGLIRERFRTRIYKTNSTVSIYYFVLTLLKPIVDIIVAIREAKSNIVIPVYL